jgi:hypothetical protein
MEMRKLKASFDLAHVFWPWLMTPRAEQMAILGKVEIEDSSFKIGGIEFL